MPTPISPNMFLALPVPTVTEGPQYAADITNNFSIIDNHDHSPGSGTPIPFNALSANQDLSLNSFSLADASSIVLVNQAFPPATSGSLYMQGNDLYFKDGSGAFDVKITSGNSVNVSGSVGFTGLPSGTASAAFIPGTGTFRFQSSTNTGAQLDVGPVIIRKQSASSKGITLVPANAIAADYTLTLPAAVPAADSLVQCDNSGNLSFVSTGSVVPSGTVTMFAGAAAPTGWLLCDGSTYDSVANPQYANLFTAIGTTYGGTGAASFKVPDCRGIFVRGVGAQTISGETYTGVLGTKQADNLESHNHGGATGSNTVPVSALQASPPYNNYGAMTGTTTVSSGTLSNSPHTHSISSSGSGTETYPANIGLNYIIKY